MSPPPARRARVRTSSQASAPQSSSAPISIGRTRDTAPGGASLEPSPPGPPSRGGSSSPPELTCAPPSAPAPTITADYCSGRGGATLRSARRPTLILCMAVVTGECRRREGVHRGHVAGRELEAL